MTSHTRPCFQWRAEKDMRDCCFICSLPSYDFEHHGNGFYQHVQHEHNMWSYIHYFIYLTNTNVNDHTALDYYVNQLVSSTCQHGCVAAFMAS